MKCVAVAAKMAECVADVQLGVTPVTPPATVDP